MTEAERLLRDYLAAGDRLDTDALARTLAHDVVTHAPGDVEARGLDAQVASWTAAHDGLDGLTHEVCDTVGREDVASARVRVRGVHTGSFLGVPPTGAGVEVDQALFVRIEHGRIVEMWEVVDTGSGLRQVGVLGNQALAPGLDDRPGSRP